MRELYWWLIEKIGYTIEIIDTTNITTWETIKYTHIVVWKYLGRFKHDNSPKMKAIWKKKIR
jgi:hypothetical protein